jgi:hypothetical protein
MKRLLSALAASLLAAACVAQRPNGPALNEYLPYAGPPIDSFHFWHLYSWETVGPYQVVLWATPWEAYFVTVASPCINLEWAHRIGVTSTANTVNHFEAIVLPHFERCPILEIRALDMKRLKAARAAQSAARKGMAPAPAPAPAPASPTQTSTTT